jgi:hypothetical protein
MRLRIASCRFVTNAAELDARIQGVFYRNPRDNRPAIGSHFLSRYITLIKGSSIDLRVVSEITERIKIGETVIV